MIVPEVFQRSPRYNKKNKKAIKVLKPKVKKKNKTRGKEEER